MNPVIFPLDTSSRGPELADLHAALFALAERGAVLREDPPRNGILAGASEDRHAGRYGDFTLRLVAELQKERGLERSGKVDARTAEVVNGLLREFGLLDAPPLPADPPSPPEGTPSEPPLPEFQHLVRGVVRYQDGLTIEGVKVEAFEKRLRSETLLGEPVMTDAEGLFEIFYSVEAARRQGQASVALLVRVTGRLEGESEDRALAESEIIFDAATVEKVVLRVPGGLRHRWSQFEQLLAEIKPLLGDVAIGSLTEDEQSQELSYLSGKLGIELKVIAQLVGAHKLAERTGIDPAVFFGFARQRLPFQLSELLSHTPIRRRNALLLAVRDLEVPGRLLDELDGIEKRFSELAAENALGNQAAMGPLGRVLATAALAPDRQRLIADRLVDHKGPIRALWAELRNDPQLGGDIPKVQLTLQLATLTAGETTLMERLAAHPQVKSTRDLARFGAEEWLTLVRTPDAQGQVHIPEHVAGSDDAEKSANYAGVMRRMVADAFPVETLAYRAQQDPNTPGPTRALLRNLTESDLALDLGRESIDRFIAKNPALLQGVTDPGSAVIDLKTRQRLFKLTRSHDEMTFLMDQGFTSSAAINRAGRTDFVRRFSGSMGGPTEALKVYEQAGNVTAGMLNMVTNLGPWFRSPTVAVPDTIPPVEGVPDWQSLFGRFDLCACAHCRSVHSAAAYFVELLSFLKERPLEVTAPAAAVRSTNARELLFTLRPDLGDIEISCDNTQLTLPYIDLVCEVLEQAIAPFVPFALPAAAAGELDARTLSAATRGAFAAVPITLQPNTFVVVVEAGSFWFITDHERLYTVRKNAVSNVVEVVSVGLQTAGSEAELHANPSRVDEAAYAKLATAVHGWRLPLDLWNEEARAWANAAAVDRAELMQAFTPVAANPDPSPLALAAARLEMSPAQVRIITGTELPAGDPWLYWGLAQAGNTVRMPNPADFNAEIDVALGWVEALAHVPLFLQQSGLSYDELLGLLATRLVNAAGAVRIESADANDAATCQLNKLRLVGLDAAVLGRMHRLVRLWRQLPWALHELDLAVQVFQGGNADPNARLNPRLMEQLGVLRVLQRRFALPLDVLLAWWGPIDTRTRRRGEPDSPASLYERLFLNATVAKPVAEAFKLDAAGAELAVTSGTLDAQAPAVLAGLGASAEELADLRRVEVPGAALDLANLSGLYRYVTLAQALRLPVADLLRWTRLAGIDPFNAGHPEDALAFADAIDELAVLGLSAAEADYLLRHHVLAGETIALAPESIAQALAALRIRLQKVGEDTAVATANAETLARFLAMLGWEPAQVELAVQAIGASVSASTTLEAGLAGFAFPAAVAGLALWEPARQTLGFRGLMSPADQAALLGAVVPAADRAAYDAAVARLAQQLADISDALRAYERPIFRTPLAEASAPDRASWPGRLKARVFYDRQAAQLCVAGLLLEQDALALDATPGDAAFKAAVRQLRAQSAGFVPDAANTFFGSADLAALLASPDTADARYAVVLSRLLPRLRRILAQTAVKQALGELVGADPAWVALLLAPATFEAFIGADFADSDTRLGVDAERFSLLYEAAISLDKAVRLARRLGFSEASLASYLQLRASVPARDVPWRLAAPAQCRWLDLLQLPIAPQARAVPVAFAALLRLCGAARLWRSAATAPLFDRLLRVAREPGSTANPAGFITLASEAIETALGWDRVDAATLIGATGLALVVPRDFQDETALKRLLRCRALAQRLNASGERALAWSRETVDAVVALQMRQALRAKHGEAGWRTLAGPVQDRLREIKRDGLVDYLIHHAPTTLDIAGRNVAAWQDANGLYAHFLIDVEMSPCFKTSRIKQGCASVQLYVQRLMLNLLPGVRIDATKDDAWLDWTWMKNYRVWEANRKIFTYPENWLEPDIRDDKTPFFKEFENELLQNELDARTAEDAFLRYLEKLDTVAKLEIVSLYQQDFAEGTQPVLHVIGRTPATPALYFYRRRTGTGRWTAWEKVDLDIEGDHVVPIVWNRRLYLFWAVFSLKAEAAIPAKDTAGPPPTKYFEVQLAWSHLRNGQWTAKRITRQRVRTMVPVKEDPNDDGRDAHVFFTAIAADGLRIWPAYDNPSSTYSNLTPAPYSGVPVPPSSAAQLNVPTFFFSSGRADAVIEDGRVIEGVYNPTGTHVRAMRFEEGVLAKATLPSIGSADLVTPSPALHLPFDGTSTLEEVALRASPGKAAFQLAFAHQDQFISGSRPFFFEDESHVFFVQPEDVTRSIRQWSIPGEVDPGKWGITVAHYYGPAALKPKLNLVAPVELAPEEAAGPFVLHSSEKARLIRRTQNIESVRPWIEEKAAAVPIGLISVARRTKQYRFETFHHPYVTEFVRELNRAGVDALMTLSMQTRREEIFAQYDPTALVNPAYPVATVDFAPAGSYSQYNWELFFHAPLLVATRLMSNQRFDEARRWLHFIFDPTNTSAEDAPAKFWRSKPLHDLTQEETLKQRIEVLIRPSASGEPSAQLALQIAEWRRNPFSPHAVARLRFTAYQKAVVMKYLDNLIAWGDHLFRQDTIESINEAIQLYLLAAEILGPWQPEIAPRAEAQVQTYNSLEPKVSALSDKLVDIEYLVPVASPDAVTVPRDATMLQVPKIPYFCVPRNEKMAGYWGAVADRLFKIRHCMNIEGVERQLALFEPPIDPALLVRARAAGVDIGGVLNDLSAPLPRYRFNVMTQKATEFCMEVKALGAALLGALEKRDAETMSLLRSTQELELLTRVADVRRDQVREAAENLAALENAKTVVEARRDFYRDMQRINPNEQVNLDKMGSAQAWQTRAQAAELVAAVVPMIGDFDIGASGWAGSPVVKWRWGGVNIGMAAQAAARGMNLLSSLDQAEAMTAGLKGGYDRRWDEWKQQEHLAVLELGQVERQIEAARIRQALAEKELANHAVQASNASALDEMMRAKFSNRELYDWMAAQVSALYFQAYQLAYDTAKRAERAYRHELALKDSNFIQFGYWDSLKKGLLAGERLFQDIKRMERAYLDNHRRDFELVKHVSLDMLHPQALAALRETGTCFFELPETLFDLDFPGHHLRRIKSVSLSLPCVTGPYTSVSAQLTLMGHRTRRDAATAGDYAWRGPDDPRFESGVGGIESIATSTAQHDSGLFELNFRDDRYLPFEYAGAISQWRLQLPAVVRQMSYDALADVVLTVRLTARDGGEPLKSAATTKLLDALQAMQVEEGRRGLFRMLSIRHDLADRWYTFLQDAATPGRPAQLELDLHAGLFPPFAQEKTIKIRRLIAMLKPAKGVVYDADVDALAVAVTRPSVAAPAALTAQSLPGELQAAAPASLDFGAGAIAPSRADESRWTFALTALPAALKKTVPTPAGPIDVLDPDKIVDLALLVRYTIE